MKRLLFVILLAQAVTIYQGGLPAGGTGPAGVGGTVPTMPGRGFGGGAVTVYQGGLPAGGTGPAGVGGTVPTPTLPNGFRPTQPLTGFGNDD